MPVFKTVVRTSSPSLGGLGTNTFHFRTTDSVLATNTLELQGATDALNSFYNDLQVNTAGLGIISTDGVWTRVDDPSGDLIDVTGWSISPTTGGNPLPPANALVIGWRASSGGKNGRGRTFLGPVSVATLQSDGTPSEAARADIDAAAADLIAGFAGGGDGAFVVWSPTDNVGRDIVSAAVRNVYGVLRSRRD